MGKLSDLKRPTSPNFTPCERTPKTNLARWTLIGQGKDPGTLSLTGNRVWWTKRLSFGTKLVFFPLNTESGNCASGPPSFLSRIRRGIRLIYGLGPHCRKQFVHDFTWDAIFNQDTMSKEELSGLLPVHENMQAQRAKGLSKNCKHEQNICFVASAIQCKGKFCKPSVSDTSRCSDFHLVLGLSTAVDSFASSHLGKPAFSWLWIAAKESLVFGSWSPQRRKQKTTLAMKN